MSGRGFLYAAIGGDMVKLGFTTNVLKRATTIQAHSPMRLIFLILERGTQDDERELHQTWSQYRKHGEWFSFTGWLKDDLDATLDEANESGRIFVIPSGEKDPRCWYIQVTGNWLDKLPIAFHLGLTNKQDIENLNTLLEKQYTDPWWRNEQLRIVEWSLWNLQKEPECQMESLVKHLAQSGYLGQKTILSLRTAIKNWIQERN